jgi:FkbM family methyltransferase
MYYKNPLTRFILRKDVLRKIRHRYAYYRRLVTKDVVQDLQRLFVPTSVETVFDVGANVGFVTYQCLKQVPNAQIHSFEPNPAVFEVLSTSYQGEPRVIANNVGVGESVGDLTFNVNANTGTSSFLKPTAYHAATQARKALPSIRVHVTTLDEYANAQGITHVHIVKLDIEGYELKALQGAHRLISEQSIDAIVAEVSVLRQYEGQPLLHEITAYLEARSYHLYTLDGFIGQETPIGQAVIGNAVYISARHRARLEEQYGVVCCGW